MSAETIITAAVRCFRAPDAQAMSRSVADLEDLLSVPPEEVMLECVWVLQAANSVLEEEIRQLASILQGQGAPLVCKAGCTGCCRQMVLCQPFEARAISGYLEAHLPVRQRFQAAYPLWDKATAVWRQSYLNWAQGRYGRGEDTGDHALEDYQVDCPFLDDAGRCDIYPVRPYGCRTCIAFDPACADAAGGQHGTRQVQCSLYTTHHAVRMAVTQMLLRRLGMEAKPVAMPEMLAVLCGLA